MSNLKKYKSKEIKSILNTLLSHSLFHMYEIEKKIVELKLKQDGTDSAEDLQKARIFTVMLTILNDSIHSAHGYACTLFDEKLIERYTINQKTAIENKLINPCSCMDCKERGYDKLSMAVERSEKQAECSDIADSDKSKN